MTLSTGLILFFIVLGLFLILCYILGIKKPKNFPPGPSWLPIIGNMPVLRKLSEKLGGQHEAFQWLSTHHKSEIIGLSLAGNLTIVVFGHRLARHVLTSSEFEGRPDNFFIRLRCMGDRRGITFTDGPLWHQQRSFVMKHLKSIGFGKQIMENMIQHEIELILHLLETNKDNLDFPSLFSPSVLNVLWTLAAGSNLSRYDPKLINLLNLLFKRTRAFGIAGGMMTQMPWLRYICPESIGYNMIVKLNNELKNFLTDTIIEHHKTWYCDRQDDLIYSFITKMKTVGKSNNTFTDDQLIIICLDLFIAGATTTSNTLDFLFLEMLLHPDIQEKAAECLNSTISPGKSITYADRLKVPYIEAIITESTRYHTVAPIIGPRRVLQNTTIDGYNIPKDTTVLIHTNSVHFDISYWGDVNIFRPERFISPEGNLIPGDRICNFSLGRRRCPGELLARQCIFLFFSSILRKYKICPLPDSPLPSSKPLPGLTLSPQKYKVRLVPRY